MVTTYSLGASRSYLQAKHLVGKFLTKIVVNAATNRCRERICPHPSSRVIAAKTDVIMAQADQEVDEPRRPETPRRPRSAQARYGAYVLVPRDDGSGIFDWYVRDQEVIPPAAQENLASRIDDFQDELIESQLPAEREKMYLEKAERIFYKGCVQENPRTEIAGRELAELVESFVSRDLAIRLARESGRVTWFPATLLVISAVIGLGLRYRIGKEGSFDGWAVGAYFIVWSASMAGVIVSTVTLPFVSRVIDYQHQWQLLSRPLLRPLSVGFAALVVALALQNGGLTFKIGSLDLTNIEGNIAIACLVGFVSAFVGSDLVKAFIGHFRRPRELTAR
jgi:hypothetical protein